MNAVDCPICGENIQFEGSPKLDQAVLCDSCETLLTVVAIKPIEVDVAENIPLSQPNRRKNRRGEKGRKNNFSEIDIDEWDEYDDRPRSGKYRKGKRGRKNWG